MTGQSLWRLTNQKCWKDWKRNGREQQFILCKLKPKWKTAITSLLKIKVDSITSSISRSRQDAEKHWSDNERCRLVLKLIESFMGVLWTESGLQFAIQFFLMKNPKKNVRTQALYGKRSPATTTTTTTKAPSTTRRSSWTTRRSSWTTPRSSWTTPRRTTTSKPANHELCVDGRMDTIFTGPDAHAYVFKGDKYWKLLDDQVRIARCPLFFQFFSFF